MENQLASWKIREAVRQGKIIKPDYCERCFKNFPKEKIAGHHNDYGE